MGIKQFCAKCGRQLRVRLSVREKAKRKSSARCTICQPRFKTVNQQ